MPTLYDENGNAVEGAILPDEAKKLQERAAKVEQLEGELGKLKDKDFNFTAFRQKSKEEQEKLKSEMSAKERLLLEEIEGLRGAVTTRDQSLLKEAKDKALLQICGSDEEYKKMVEAEFERLPGETNTPDQIQAKLLEADSYVRFKTQRPSAPLHTFVPNGFNNSFSPTRPGKSYADTPEGEALAKDLGLRTKPLDQK